MLYRADRVRQVGPNRGSNTGQNRQARGIAAKVGLTLDEWWKLSREIEQCKRSGAYDLDINGNLDPADIEDLARGILDARKP